MNVYVLSEAYLQRLLWSKLAEALTCRGPCVVNLQRPLFAEAPTEWLCLWNSRLVAV